MDPYAIGKFDVVAQMSADVGLERQGAVVSDLEVQGVGALFGVRVDVEG